MEDFKNNFKYRALCCFCAEKFALGDLESHMKTCLNGFSKTINERVLMRPEYEQLFMQIRQDDFNFSFMSMEKYLDEFNKQGLKIYEDYELMTKLTENLPAYQERLGKALQDVTFSTKSVDIVTVLRNASKIFSQYIELKSTFNDVKPLLCFLCAREINFWSYDQHIKSCCNSYHLDPSHKGMEIHKPNFNIIVEILKEMSKQESLDKFYLNFLFKEFLLEAEVSLKKNTGATSTEEAFEKKRANLPSKKKFVNKFSSTKEMNGTSSHIFERKFEDRFEEEEKKKSKKYDPLSIKCFICGEMFTTNGFEIHYLDCKDEYSKKSGIKKIVEPEYFLELLNKIVSGFDVTQELDEYNTYAEKAHWELIAKICHNCKRKFNPESYEKHIKSCSLDFQKKNLNNQDYEAKKENYENYSFKDIEKKRIRKKSMDDIRNYDIKEIRNNIKHYFI